MDYEEHVAQLAEENDHIDQDNLDICFINLLTLVRTAAWSGDMLI